MKSIIILLLISLSTYSYSQFSIEYSTAFSLPFSLKKAGNKTFYNSIERNYYDWNAYGFDNRLMLKKEFEKISLGVALNHHYGNRFNIDDFEDSLRHDFSYASSKVISLDPMIYFKRKKIDIGLGIIAALHSSTEYNIINEDKINEKIIYSINKLVTKFRFGFLSEINYTLYDNGVFIIKSGLSYRHLNLKSKKSEIIHYEVDGLDRLSSLNTKNSQTIYVKEISSNANTSNDEPSEELIFNVPFSALLISLNFELKI